MMPVPSPAADSLSTPRQRIPFDAAWHFHLGDLPGAQAPELAAESWRVVDLPHDWSIETTVDPEAPAEGAGGFFPTGIGWYRRTFAAPRAWQDRRVAIVFEGASRDAEVWINGVRLGKHPYPYTPFRYDLTPHLKSDANNVLAVRVDNSEQPNSRWYAGSGLYRHAWLELTGPVHFVPDGVFVSTSALSPDSATVRAEYTARNDTDTSTSIVIETTLLDPDSHAVASARQSADLAAGGETTATFTIEVPQPSAWSPENPVLYRALTRVLSGDRVLDELTTTFGLRTIRVSAERGFELNGKSIELAGGNVHHDNGVLGAAAFDRAEERRVELLKAAGFNAVRTSHNPPSPAFLAACDRLGLLVMDEAFDGWRKSKMAEDYGRDFDEWWQRDLGAMVRRDRNHPSVVLWSIGNEVYERGSAAGAQLAHQLAGRIRRLDTTRPITAGINGLGEQGDWTELDPLFAALDVAGYNYEIARAAGDHARLPARVIVCTESYPADAFAGWAAAHDLPFVIGDFVWSALDYLGEAGIGRVFPPDQPVVRHWEGNQFPWHGAACGDIDLTGWRKPISHYRNIVWDRGEKLYAAVIAPAPGGGVWNLSPWATPPALPSWTWPGHEGEELTVEVYSRYDAVRVYLDGKRLGEKPTTRAEQFKATFAIPYAPGTLEVKGVQAGREEETFTLKTAGTPARLHLTADRRQLHAGSSDVAFITVEVIDADGQWQPTSEAAVRIAIDGPATLAGFGNADMTSLESYRANPHRVHQGRALLVIRTTDSPGRIEVTATASDLAPARMQLEASAP